MQTAAARRRATHLAIVFVLACTAVGRAPAQERADAPTAAESGSPVATEAAVQAANNALPALEIIGFDFLLNRFNRVYSS